ncbi:MAG: hypothetical protein IPK17_13995 [Chloroflexi bacterium]|uniref:hypothetical protein n=1 Tax=Candidatus Flexifilum breve TaxID=3140694 RepID=UPI0031357880|nr:hypothetical protein [Chloroflexota bacterium]
MRITVDAGLVVGTCGQVDFDRSGDDARPGGLAQRFQRHTREIGAFALLAERRHVRRLPFT